MMDTILMLMKDSVEDAVSRNSQIPWNRKDLVTEISVKAISDSFRRCFVSDDMPSLVSLFSGIIDLKGKLMVNDIKNAVKNDLMLKAGITDAASVANSIVHESITAIWNRINTQENSDFTLTNLVYIYSGRKLEQSDRDKTVVTQSGNIPRMLN